MYHVFCLDDGEKHFYVASSGQDAMDQHKAVMGEADFYPDTKVAQMPDEEPLTIWDEDTNLESEKLCQQWASIYGRCCIASTAY